MTRIHHSRVKLAMRTNRMASSLSPAREALWSSAACPTLEKSRLTLVELGGGVRWRLQQGLLGGVSPGLLLEPLPEPVKDIIK